MLVAQLYLTFCNPLDYSLLDSSVHGIPQERILEWVAISFSRGIFPTQGSNPGLLHCRQILYHQSHQGSPNSINWLKMVKTPVGWTVKSLIKLLSWNQFSSVAQSCPILCDPMNCSTPGLPVHHQLPEFTQTRVHRVNDAIQPSHPLSSPSPPAPNHSQRQSLFQ